MKNLYQYLIVMVVCSSFISITDIPFTTKTYENFAFFFDSKEEVVDFFDFHKGDVVADIGAGRGVYEGVFSLFTEGVTFYAQDIDAKTLNKKTLEKCIRKASKLKGSPIQNTFHIQIGSVTATGLPDNSFDKIILISTLHEFSNPNEMLDDIDHKLKKGGRVYILETHCYSRDHTNVSAEQVKTLFQDHHFRLVKQQEPKTPKTHLFIFEKQ